MRSERGRQLVSRFLGADAAEGGPFALLGLDPDSCTPGLIEAALQRQLDRVAQHADADSPDADEVRLVLDTAATDLLDPAARRRHVADRVHMAGATGAPAATVPTPSGPAAVHNDHGDPIIRRMLMWVGIGLAIMVVVLGLGVWLVSNTGKPAVPSATAVSPAPASPMPPPAAAASQRPPEAPVPVAAPLAPLRTRGRSEFVDGDQLIRELRMAAGELKADPDRALARFERAYAVFADWWCRYDSAKRSAAADAVVECIYMAAARPERVSRLLAAITEPVAALRAGERPITADEVWPAAWSAGILARINRERGLPPQVAAALAEAFSAALGTARPTGELSVETGVAAAMRLLPGAILGGTAADIGDGGAGQATAAFKRWAEGVALIAPGEANADRRERALVDALDWVMTQSPEPDADPRVFEAIGLLGAEIKWRSAGPARGRLIEWFRDRRVSAADLRTLTSAIATRSSAEGVDASMVLSMSGGAEARSELRGRYAGAWLLAEASVREDVALLWVGRAKAAIADPPRDDELDQLAAAADLAELNRDAIKVWRGGSGGQAATGPAPAAGAIAPQTPPSSLVRPAVSSGGVALGSVTGNAADGAWAERYLGAERSIPARLARLAELDQSGPPIGFIDSAVLAEAACFASPVQVRAPAVKLMAKFADEPAMVNAMLDLLPSAPRTRSASDLFARVSLGTLPRPNDADWELAARRALVERLLAMVADEGVHGLVEQSALRIAGAYLDAAGEPLSAGTTDASAVGARRGAALLVEEARREAEGQPASRATRFSLEKIERRAVQRARQSVGPIQDFASEQSTLAEYLGYLVATERPEREARAVEVLDACAAARRKARHVFAQVWAAERAMTQLWLLRFDMEGRP